MAAIKLHLSKSTINALPIIGDRTRAIPCVAWDPAKPAPEEPLAVWDDEVAGFQLLVMPTGRKVFYLHRRTRDGTQFKLKLGQFGVELSAEQARTEARRICAAVAIGQDPAAERRAARQKRKERQAAPTVAQMWEACLRASTTRPKSPWSASTARLYEGWMRCHVLPDLGAKKANEVEAVDVRKMYRGIVQKAPPTADQALRTLSSVYSWAIAQDDFPQVTKNPCKAALDRNSKGPGAQARDREPEGDELERVVRALEDRGDLIGVFFLLLVMTGARENELIGAMWRDFDLEVERPVWRKPVTKTGRPHRVTLSEQAVELLRAIKQEHPFAPFSWLKEHAMRREWRKVCAAAGVTDLRIHDWARHFHASLLAAEGYTLIDIGKALGHRSEATSKRYTHLIERRQREAAARVGEVIRLAGRRA
jgi:integrase